MKLKENTSWKWKRFCRTIFSPLQQKNPFFQYLVQSKELSTPVSSTWHAEHSVTSSKFVLEKIYLVQLSVFSLVRRCDCSTDENARQTRGDYQFVQKKPWETLILLWSWVHLSSPNSANHLTVRQTFFCAPLWSFWILSQKFRKNPCWMS